MLRRLSLRDFVIVAELEVEFASGFSVLTGETGAGKSILVDALQLALGSRGDAGVVREGALRAEIGAEFDAPDSLTAWLDEAGFAPGPDEQGRLLLRRTIDAQGKSRAWINGGAATIAQLREAADHLVDIHGQHAWQSLTRAPAVRSLLDGYAGIDTAALVQSWSRWRQATEALADASTQQAGLERERERLAWQIGEVGKLAPGAGEWAEIDAEHRRLANAQALIDAARAALDAISDAEENADALAGRAVHALVDVAAFDPALAATIEVLQGAQAQLQDAAHTLGSYLNHNDPEPQRLQALDERMSAWLGLARRYRRSPDELPALLAQWQDELRALDAAADLDALRAECERSLAAFTAEAGRVSASRRKAAPKLAAAVTQALQQLGMGGGVFEVALTTQDAPQSFGSESAEFLVAGHAGSTPRPLAKVASGGELSRLALAIAVTTVRGDQGAGTLIFDEIDAGIGGAVGDSVGQLMKQLGATRQVLAVTHLAQVASCADQHYVVAKLARDGAAASEVRLASKPQRVVEIARMLGGERMGGTSLAHAQALLQDAASGPNDLANTAVVPTTTTATRSPSRSRSKA